MKVKMTWRKSGRRGAFKGNSQKKKIRGIQKKDEKRCPVKGRQRIEIEDKSQAPRRDDREGMERGRIKINSQSGEGG